MTIEELQKVKFHFVSHLSMADEHCTTYASEDNRLGWCEHVPFKDGEPYGRSTRHYRIDTKVYKSKKKFLEALQNFSPNVVPFHV